MRYADPERGWCRGVSPGRPATIAFVLLASLAGGPVALASDNGAAASPPMFLSITPTERGLIFKTPDDAFRLKVGGRIQLDVGNGGVSGLDFTDALNRRGEMRRLYAELYATLWDTVELAYQHNFARDDFPIKDAAIAIRKGPFVVSFGNLSEPVGQEELVGANNLTFMEPALANALVPGANVGLTAGVFGERWSFVAGYFGGNINDSVDNRGTASAARVSYAPYLDGANVLHLAVGGSFRQLDGTELSFNNRPEARLFDGSLVRTGTIDGARNVTRWGAEAAWQQGPVRIQSEYTLADVTRVGAPDLRFQGAYVEAAWLLNAASGRPYSVGTPYGTTFGIFERMPVPSELRVTRGGPGVLELAARFSWLELSNEDVRGGMERNITLGINWYPEPNVRLTANYIHAEAIRPFDAGGRVVADILMGRLHLRY